VIARIAPDPLPSVRLVYHHPGRLRLRGDVLEQGADAANRLGDVVARVEGVNRVAHNRVSGSLLVEYAPERIDAEGILAALPRAGVRLDDSPRRRDASRVVIGAARDLSAHVSETTRGAADLNGVVAFALGLGGLTSVVLGRSRWPRWDNLLFWSYTLFRDGFLRQSERGRRYAR
jgi:hypothetical protein